MTTVKLDSRNIIDAILGKASRGINKTLVQAKEYAQAISPTDTKEYINSRKTKDATLKLGSGGQLIAEGLLINDAPHARIIEFGVMGQRFNYHKGPPRDESTVIRRGVGNRTAQRTQDAMKSILIQNIKNA